MVRGDFEEVFSRVLENYNDNQVFGLSKEALSRQLLGLQNISKLTKEFIKSTLDEYNDQVSRGECSEFIDWSVPDEFEQVTANIINKGGEFDISSKTKFPGIIQYFLSENCRIPHGAKIKIDAFPKQDREKNIRTLYITGDVNIDGISILNKKIY